MLTALDNFLLQRLYIPLSQFAGRQWGSTACSLSRSCIAPMVVFSGIFVATSEADGVGKGVLIFLDLLLAGIFWWQAADADLVPNPHALMPPFIRVFWVYWPLITLVFFSASLHWIADLARDLAAVSCVYFRAVPAPPPKKQKRRAPAMAWGQTV